MNNMTWQDQALAGNKPSIQPRSSLSGLTSMVSGRNPIPQPQSVASPYNSKNTGSIETPKNDQQLLSLIQREKQRHGAVSDRAQHINQVASAVSKYAVASGSPLADQVLQGIQANRKN